ncbi:MFS transporter [Bacillus sp. FJAT-49711]|uniref:MFS transporter n=1 Tax=Bacillus sp. FJAT-49711 TaxID=2833585 RepID=UPI001BCA37D2|nr:MFS transporter [Bacillus sp. FJAT-49711]MBS4221132.1 MFS transporter [Bacillus sp. FJAT-49711]
MKKALLSLIASLLSLVLIGWGISAIYDANLQFANIIKKPEPPWEILINTTPFIFLFIFVVIVSIFYSRKKKKQKNITFWLYPFEFSEADERERQISGEACRKAFVSTMITAPFAAILLVFYPFIESSFSYYPIIIILMIPAIQVIVYYLNIRRI